MKRQQQNLKLSWRAVILALALAVLAGCQAPANMQQLQAENKTLQQQLRQAQRDIDTLKQSEASLKANVDELERVVGVLDTEKSSRVQESSQLRAQVRQFVQQHIDALKAFLVDSNLLDYVGGELVERSEVSEQREPILLVDFANPVPARGTLTGVEAIAIAPTRVNTKVLRKVEDRWVVIWESGALSFDAAGFNRASFPVSVGVERGDVLAYYFPEGAAISFDTGTGDTRYRDEDILIGGVLKSSSLKGARERRAYSLGVFGLLN